MKRFSALLFAALFFAPALLPAQLDSFCERAHHASGSDQGPPRALPRLLGSRLKHQPEFASTIGDKRYNDQISDYSVKAINDWLATEQEFLMKLAAIDPTGLTDQDKTSRELTDA